MARQTHDREDLLREATALVQRVELALPGGREPLVAGFRRDGAISFFFGADPVYQFNRSGELRRAFVDGKLIKAEGGRLVALCRERTERETILRRRELSEGESEALLQRLATMLTDLSRGLAAGAAQVTGEVPAGGGVLAQVQAWLEARPPRPAIAERPHASG